MAHLFPDITGDIDVIADSEVMLQYVSLYVCMYIQGSYALWKSEFWEMIALHVKIFEN